MLLPKKRYRDVEDIEEAKKSYRRYLSSDSDESPEKKQKPIPYMKAPKKNFRTRIGESYQATIPGLTEEIIKKETKQKEVKKAGLSTSGLCMEVERHKFEIDEELKQSIIEVISRPVYLDNALSVLGTFKDGGGTQDIATITLEHMRTQGDGDFQDRVLEIMNFVTGFCSIEKAIWKTTR